MVSACSGRRLGKQFILSLEDSRLENFSLTHYNFMSSEHGLNMQICMLLDIVAASE